MDTSAGSSSQLSASSDSSSSSTSYMDESSNGASSSSSSSPDTFCILAAGDHLVKMNREILQESATIQRLAEFFDSMEEQANDPQGPCGTPENPFPLPSLGVEILSAVAVWVEEHAPYYVHWRTMTNSELASDEQNSREWKGLMTTTVKGLFNSHLLFELFRTAEFLEMRSLTIACTKYCSYCLSHYTADELRRIFKIPRDLTDKQEEELTNRILRLQVMLPIEDDYADMEEEPKTDP